MKNEIEYDDTTVEDDAQKEVDQAKADSLAEVNATGDEEEAVEKDEAAGSQSVVWLPKNVIDAHPNNPRVGERSEDIVDAMRATLEHEGFPPRFAIVVRKLGDRYQVVEGHGRLKAALDLDAIGLVPCWIAEMNDAQTIEWLGRSNVHDPMTFLEVAIHSFLIVPDDRAERKAGRKTIAEYAREIGMQGPNLSRARNGAQVFNAVKANLSDETIRSARHFGEQFAVIYKSPAENWESLVTECVAKKWKVHEAKAAVAEINEKKSDGAPLTEAPSEKGSTVAATSADSSPNDSSPGDAAPVANTVPEAKHTFAADSSSHQHDGFAGLAVSDPIEPANSQHEEPRDSVPHRADPVVTVLSLLSALSLDDQEAVILSGFSALPDERKPNVRAKIGVAASPPEHVETSVSPGVSQDDSVPDLDASEGTRTDGPKMAKAKSSRDDAAAVAALRERLTNVLEAKQIKPKDLVGAGIFHTSEQARLFRKAGAGITSERAKSLAAFLDELKSKSA